jgi:hypothetical protein
MATIYKISSTAGEKVYIGSTTQSFSQRWSVHKADHLRGHPCTSQILFDEYGVDTCSIEEIEKVDLDKRVERERFWIEKEKCVNIVVPGRTRAEYRQDNKERILEYKKAYDLAYKERISEYDKAYRLANSDKIKARTRERITCPTCGKNLSRGNMSRHNKLHQE